MTLADYQISLIAQELDDLLETKFELIRAGDYDRAAHLGDTATGSAWIGG